MYIDSGEISQRYQGEFQNSRGSSTLLNRALHTKRLIRVNPVNSTLSLDLSHSWRSIDVEMMEIRKDAPKIKNQNYFREYDSNSFFTWGGFVPNATRSPTQLWKFTADGNGSGVWSVEDKYSQELSSLRRSHGGAFASTPDSGFYFGGFEETKTNIDLKMPLGGYVPGYLQFNYTTPTGLPAWTNRTDTPYSPSGTLYAATAHYIPRYGSQGLIMILAGAEYNSTNQEPGNLSMEVVWFIDPVTKRWYSQKTIGEAPQPRRWACVVGVQSLDNTYDM